LPIVGTWALQTKIEQYLLLTVAICVPLMLFVKPIAYSLMAPKHGPEEEAQALMDKVSKEVTGKKFSVRVAQKKVVAQASTPEAAAVDDDGFQKVKS